MRISVQGFIGEIPRASARLLPDGAAQAATNCKLWSGELRPWRDFTTANTPVKTGAAQTIYPLTAASTYWMSWVEDVNAVRGPIAGDVTDRTYLSGLDAPRVTDNVLVNAGLSAGSLLHFYGAAGSTVITDENAANTWAAAGNAQISAAQSKFDGRSLLLDGTGDYVTGAAVALAAGTGFNRSIWFRATALATARAILSATENFKFAVKISATQKLELSLGDGATWTIANAVAGATTLATGTWYRARVAWNGATYKLYLSVNGAAETEEASVTSAVAHASGTGTRIGADHTPAFEFNGHIAEYRNAVALPLLGVVTPPAVAYAPVAVPYPKHTYRLGIPVQTVAPVATLGGGGSGTAVSRAYVWTMVTAWGEESAPSPASNIVAALSGQTVTVNGFPALPDGDYQITLRRLYRVVTGVTGAEYLFVAEQAATTTSFVETLTDSQLGEVLETTDWLPPPDGLKGLISLPNGVMAGFVGNQVYLSVPYAPYAWPLAYKQVTDFEVIALGHFGTTIVAGTNGQPYIINGVDPAYASPSKYPGILSCVSKRSLVSTQYGVLYASSQGLVRATGSGAELITIGIIDADDWQDLKPATIHGVFFNDMYVGFYSTGIVDGLTQGAGFILEGINTGNLHLTRLDFYRYGTFLDAETNKLYMIKYDGAVVTVEEWEAAGTRKTYVWRSKVFAHAPLCLTAAKVVANYEATLTAAQVAALQAARDAGVARNAVKLPIGRGAINGGAINAYPINGNDFEAVPDVPAAETSSVEFKLYSNGVLKYTAAIASDEPFRMPAGYSGSETEIELSGVAPVQEVVVAQNVSELADS